MARILIVEDEPDIALGLELDLRDEGYEAEVISDGETASRRGREPGWDTAFPELSGNAVVANRGLRAHNAV